MTSETYASIPACPAVFSALSSSLQSLRCDILRLAPQYDIKSCRELQNDFEKFKSGISNVLLFSVLKPRLFRPYCSPLSILSPTLEVIVSLERKRMRMYGELKGSKSSRMSCRWLWESRMAHTKSDAIALYAVHDPKDCIPAL